MTDRGVGLEHGLTNYGDRDFSLYLRRSFAQSMGYSRAMLGKPVVNSNQAVLWGCLRKLSAALTPLPAMPVLGRLMTHM